MAVSVCRGLTTALTVQRGVPVATVAINNGMNAGLLAIRILAASDRTLQTKMDDYLKSLEREVIGKVQKLEEVGWEHYVVKR